MKKQEKNPILSIQEVAILIDVQAETLKNWIRKNVIKTLPLKTSTGMYFYHASDLKKLNLEVDKLKKKHKNYFNTIHD